MLSHIASTSEADLAQARTVNNLPHLDLAAYVGAAAREDEDWEGGEHVYLDDCGLVAGGVSLGDVTCMALVRDEEDAVKDVLLTGSRDGWVHCWRGGGGGGGYGHGPRDPDAGNVEQGELFMEE